MALDGLIHGESRFPISFTSMTALALLRISLAAIATTAFNISVFG